MDTEKLIVGFVGLMILGVILLAVVLPTTIDGIAGAKIAGTVSNEVFTTTGASAQTALARYVVSVSKFDKATYETKTNSTAITSNGSGLIYLNANYYNGLQANLTYCYNNTPIQNASIYHNGVRLGNIPGSTGCATYTGEQSRLTGTQNISLINSNGTTATLTNVSMFYAYWATNGSYAVANGFITPLDAATYRASYNFGANNTATVDTLLGVIPLILAVMFVLIIIGFWKMAG